jgi:hypothetical protein
MFGHSIRPPQFCRCAYCGEPLAFTSFWDHCLAHGKRVVCNEFCAGGISFKGHNETKKAPTVVELLT